MLAERAFAMDEAGIAELCQALIEMTVCRVAIERPDGVLVERLLAAGLTVLAIHPNQVKAARPRFTAAGGKSDRFDAFVLAELARTDSHRFRALALDGDDTRALQGTHARPRGARRRPHGTLQPAARAAARVLARRHRRLRRRLTARSPWPSWSATPAPPTRAASAPGACKPSWTATPTAAARHPSGSWPSCAPHRPAAPASSRPTRAAPPCSD